MKNRSLRVRITLTIILVVVLALLCLGLVFYINSGRITKMMTKSNREMSLTSAQKSSDSMARLTETRLKELAVDKANIADDIFLDFVRDVSAVADAATQIYAAPNTYSGRETYPPEYENEGILSVQILYSSSTDPEDEQIHEEAMLLGNLQDILYAINDNNPSMASIYFASESGIVIQADYIADKKYNDAGQIMPLDLKTRPWYTGAVAKGSSYITPITRDVHTPNLAIMCGIPVYRNNRLMGVAGSGIYLNDIEALVYGLDLGENGDACIINQVGQVLFSTFNSGILSVRATRPDLRESDIPELADLVTRALNKESAVETLTLNEETRYVAYAPLKTVGWSLFVFLTQDSVEEPTRQLQADLEQISSQALLEADQTLKRSSLILVAVILTILLVSLAVSLLLSRRIAEPIRQLTEEVSQLEGDRLDFKMPQVVGDDETQLLAASFASLTGRMKSYISDIQSITAERERIGTELSLATRIQADMLPNVFPAFPDRKDFDIYASMTPAKEVGGDFYDFFLIDETHLALVIADVSGKGIPAALFMMVSMILIRNHVLNGSGPAEALKKINDQICANNREEMFVTVWLGILDLTNGELTAANAGHEYPILKKPDGHFELVKDPHGFVIGGLPDMSYREYVWKLDPGASLFVYTDGVPEAHIEHMELFGTDRLLKTLKTVEQENPEDILHAVENAVNEFMGEAPRFDDLTMLCVKYNGPAEEKSTEKAISLSADVQENLGTVTEWINTELDALNVPDRTRMQINVAVDEIFSNVAFYAYKGQPGPITVRFKAQEEPSAVVISFEDEGMAFDPLNQPEPDLTLPTEERPIGGLGIFLVKKTMDDVAYVYRDGKNVLTITKLL